MSFTLLSAKSRNMKRKFDKLIDDCLDPYVQLGSVLFAKFIFETDNDTAIVYSMDNDVSLCVRILGMSTEFSESDMCKFMDSLVHMLKPIGVVIELEREVEDIVCRGLKNCQWTFINTADYGDRHHLCRYVGRPCEGKIGGIDCTVASGVMCSHHKINVRLDQIDKYWEVKIHPPVIWTGRDKPIQVSELNTRNLLIDSANDALVRKTANIQLDLYKPPYEAISGVAICDGFRIAQGNACEFEAMCKYLHFRQHHFARIIQRAWKRCVSDPQFSLCRNRLMHEWSEMFLC